jgi:sterol desaturase/sphingolipid hydroxylase (fatty acid hydroxylase superfamily)
MEELKETLAALALLTLMFLPLERLFPAHRQRVFREQWATDFAFFLGQYLLWTAPVVAVLVAVRGVTGVAWLDGLRGAFGALPWLVQVVLAMALSDAATYWAHRLSHSVPLLWRFHRVHHSAPRLDWLAAHREHPLDNVYTRLVENLPLMLLGLPLSSLAGFVMFRGLWSLYIHSNVALDPGPLRRLLGAPRLHHWHHEEQRGGRVNFANLSPLMDLAFGTYFDPGHFPERYGDGNPVPRSYASHLVAPFLPRARSATPTNNV